MKKAVRKFSSILLTLCMVLTLAPVPVQAEGDTVEPGTINISTHPVELLTGEGYGASPGSLTVEAGATNGSALHYEWYVYVEFSHLISPAWGSQDSNSYVLPSNDLPAGMYQYWCKITADGCVSVESKKTTVMLDKATWNYPTKDTVYVKAGKNTTGNYYELPRLAFNTMYYTVSGSAISTLITEEPLSILNNDDLWNVKRYTTFNTVAQEQGTKATITYVAKDDTGNYNTLYKDFVFSLTVEAVDKIPVTISGVTGVDATYTGRGQQGYGGTPTVPGYAGDFDYRYTGRGSTVYDSAEKPVDAGDYTVTISVPGDNKDYTGSVAVDFTILKKEIKVIVSDLYISRLDDIPEINAYYSGFIGADSEENCLYEKAVPRIPVSGTAIPGSYDITYQTLAQLNERGNKNYTLTYEKGLLIIGQYSNGKEVLSINLPSAVITSSGDASITGTIGQEVSSLTLSATVSEGATWTLYQDKDLTQEITDKTVSLALGNNIVYLKVTAESGMSNRYYTVTITRQSGSITPDPGTTPNPPTTPNLTTASAAGGGNISFQATGSEGSWKDISKGIENTASSQVTVEMSGTTVIPASVLETIAGKNITVTFELNDKVSWSISGSSLKAMVKKEGLEVLKALDMKAVLGSSNIPAAVLEDFSKQLGQKDARDLVPLSLSHEGSFGFTAYLSVYMESAGAGKTANLFYYNPVTGQLEFQYAAVIDGKGYVRFPFHHASDYIIALDDGKVLQTELNKTSLTADKKILYVGGNTGKETGLCLDLPYSLLNLSNEDTLYPVITYTSSNPKIVSVTADGKVKAIGAGKAAITASITAGGKVKTLKTALTVKPAYIKLVEEKNSFVMGERYTYKAVGYGITTDKITFSTTKKAVVVIGKKTGKAIARSKGTDIVAASYGSIQKKIKVTVK